MRHRGLLAGMMLGLFVVAGFAQAENISVFERKIDDQSHKFAIQINGGGSMFAMSDVNDRRLHLNHNANDEEAELGIGFSIAGVYRQFDNFRWTFGYTNLGEDVTRASWRDDQNNTVLNEFTVNASELFVTGSYALIGGERFHLDVFGGIAYVSGHMDWVSTAGKSVYDAEGRTLGFKAGIAGEVFITKGISFNFNAGYRYANIGKLETEEFDIVTEVYTDTEIFWSGSKDNIELDFSGITFEGGLRFYFEPATGWFIL